ncbi:MAG: carboxylating nicotinate-nucleotide diphosphorylase [Bacteroidales bacterium]|nr:carboxylating nicotinate-nucleotide diphosphorylase [Bacteroidales bacterium]
MNIEEIIRLTLMEDIGESDHTTLSTVPAAAVKHARMIAKQAGILCGTNIVAKVFTTLDPHLTVDIVRHDGDAILPGDVILRVSGNARAILTGERTALNFIQRMSGIATKTHSLMKKVEGTNAKLLDTRKTTPLLRELEKYAVKCGGGDNHRFGLFDMVLIKDNHVDFAGGINAAILSANDYLTTHGKPLQIEIEVRNFDELREALQTGSIHRIMLDNFTPEQIRTALNIIAGKYPVEASGGITEENIRQYAETGVDYISVGALTHHIKSLDISLLAD